VVAFLVVKVAVLVVNLRWFPTLVAPSLPAGADQRSGAAPAGRTALLVPVRNETARLARTVPGLLDAGFDEVVFLDDESTDDSAQWLTAAAAARDSQLPKVTVVAGQQRPPGWVGKTWACAQLAEQTTADVLVFCDSDVQLAPGAAVAVAGALNAQAAAVLSVFCRQRTGSWSERLLTPLITDVVLCFLPFGLLRAPVPAAATASGAVLAFHRSAYQRLGGFEAVRGELVEDLAIARRTRRAGEQLGLVLGGDIAQVRMYDNFRQVIDGFGRSLSAAVGGRRWLLVAGVLWHFVAYTVPVLLQHRSPWWRWAAALGIAERLLVEGKTGGRDWFAALLVCLSPIAAVPVAAQAVRRTQSWKGRVYR
jgi:glycosyltransferase involved in cell wall biosynthesis